MQRENYLSSVVELRWEEQFPKSRGSASEALKPLINLIKVVGWGN